MAIFSAIGSIIAGISSAVSSAAGAIGGALGLGGSGANLGAVAGGISAAAGVAGTVMQAVGANKMADAQERAERVRQTQMDLEAQREKRAMVRRAVITRAQVQNAAGATDQPNSTGLQGGLGNITSQTGQNIQGVNTGQQLGQAMFGINRQISSGQTLASIGGAVSGIGNQIASNFETFNRVFA